MPWTIEHPADAGFIQLTASGRQLRDDAIEQTRQIFHLGQQLDLHCYLLDCSLAEYELERLDVFMLPKIYQLLEVPAGSRLAVITPVSGHKAELYRYYQQVCAAHRYTARLFASRQAALAWLASQAAVSA
jgi:hypothetical protein